MRSNRFRNVCIFLVLALGASALAFAHDDHYRNYSPAYGASTFDIGYQRGYQDGIRHGERDRFSGVNYNYAHSREYKKADSGYSRSFGDKGVYRNGYRDGYVAGYNKGYHGRDDGYGRSRYGRYDGYEGRGFRRSSYGLPYDQGYQAGYNQAVRDFRERIRYRLTGGDLGFVRALYRSDYGDYRTFERGVCDGYRTGYYRR